MDAVSHIFLAKVDHQSQFQVHQTQVRQYLRLEDWVVSYCCLHFNNDQFIDKNIKPKRIGHSLPFVYDWHIDLSLNKQILLPQLPHQRLFVDTFEQTRPTQRSMHLNRTSNNLRTELIF